MYYVSIVCDLGANFYFLALFGTFWHFLTFLDHFLTTWESIPGHQKTIIKWCPMIFGPSGSILSTLGHFLEGSMDKVKVSIMCALIARHRVKPSAFGILGLVSSLLCMTEEGERTAMIITAVFI